MEDISVVLEHTSMSKKLIYRERSGDDINQVRLVAKIEPPEQLKNFCRLNVAAAKEAVLPEHKIIV